MAISRSTIMRYATGESYRRGQDIFLVSHRIREFNFSEDPFSDETVVRGSVLDASGDVHQAEVCVNEHTDQIPFFACDCEEAAGDPSHLCRHSSALLLKYISRRDLAERNESVRHEAFDRLSRDLIRAYAFSLPEGGDDEPLNGSISLEPTLIVEDRRCLLELKVGGRKKYIIRNLLDFYQAMQHHDRVSYGKSLEFYHVREAFAEDSLQLLDFTMHLCDAYLTHFNFDQARYYNVRVLRALRAMPLASADLQRLLTLMIGRSIQVKIEDLKKDLAVVQADPALSMSLTPSESDRSWLIWCDKVHVLPCREQLWLMTGERIYGTSPEYDRDMRIFLNRVPQLSDHPLRVSGGRQRSFTGSVLKKVAPHMLLDTHGLDRRPTCRRKCSSGFILTFRILP